MAITRGADKEVVDAAIKRAEGKLSEEEKRADGLKSNVENLDCFLGKSLIFPQIFLAVEREFSREKYLWFVVCYCYSIRNFISFLGSFEEIADFFHYYRIGEEVQKRFWENIFSGKNVYYFSCSLREC